MPVTFQDILFPEEKLTRAPKKKSPGGTGKSRSKKLVNRGCEFCPRNNVPGLVKIKGTVRGKQIFFWAQSPGVEENNFVSEKTGKRGRELVGRSGRWLWKECVKVGIERKDVDIQNVVRCLPADRKGGRWVLRDPSKEELFCCSKYTDEALLKSDAVVHVIFGKFAGKQLLGKEYKKDRPIFKSRVLKAWVVLQDHPSYFIRGYAPKERLQKFRTGLQMAKLLADNPGGPYEILKKKNYVLVETAEQALKAKRILKAQLATLKVPRLSADIEDTKDTLLMVGFCAKPGSAFLFVVDHPKAKGSPHDKRVILKVIKYFLEKSRYKKSFHSGIHDKPRLKSLKGIIVRGYDFDTRWSTYMWYPGWRSYALENCAYELFPEFTSYKEIVMPEAAPEGVTYEEASKKRLMDFSKVPLEKLRVYTGADCDLGKRLEIGATPHISLPLLRTYVHAGFTIKHMEVNGPFFDRQHYAVLKKIYPPRLAARTKKIQLMVGNPEFNPGSPIQVSDFMYKKLKLPILSDDGKPDTQKETLELLAARGHKFPKEILLWRHDEVVDSRYLDGFKESADTYEGRLRTIWHLTGTTTGRLRSGGGKKEGKEGIINLQNVHGDVQLQNLLISDLRWREFYKRWKKYPKEVHKWIHEYDDLYIFLSSDYAQIEIRMLAVTCGDKALQALFHRGEDIHQLVGHEITGWDMQKIKSDKQVRKLVKNLHFGLVYGLKGEGMLRFLQAKGVDTDIDTVNEFLGNYFRKFPKVLEFIEDMHAFARRHGYVENILGYRTPIKVREGRGEDGEGGGAYWANQAVNSPIQGGAHQLLVCAMALLSKRPSEYSQLAKKLCMEIHDAMIYRVKLKNLLEAFKQNTRLLQHDVITVLKDDFKIKWPIPLVAESTIGFRYGTQVPDDDHPTLLSTEGALPKILAGWCHKNRKLQVALYKELAAAPKKAA